MTSKPQNRDFDIFVGNLLDAYRQFCYWHFLSQHLPESLKKGLENRTFWITTQSCFLRGYLSESAKIFERKKDRSPDVLSIYYLLDIQFEGFEDTIDKLKKLRDKVLMHAEVDPARDIDNFMKELSLTPKMIQDLLCRTINVTEQIRANYGISGNIVPLFNDLEEKCRKEVMFLLSIKQ